MKEIVFDIFQLTPDGGWFHNIVLRSHTTHDDFEEMFRGALEHYAEIGAMYYTNIVNDLLFDCVDGYEGLVSNTRVEDNIDIQNHRADAYYLLKINDYYDADEYDFKVLDYEGYKNIIGELKWNV